MATEVQPGDVLELTAPAGGVVNGTGYKIRGFFVVATVTAAAGERFNGALEEVWPLAKVTAEPWLEGTLIYFNTGTAQCSSLSVGGTLSLIGGATRNEAVGTTVGYVRLNGQAIA